MAYTVSFNQATSDLFGYLFVQPFSFDGTGVFTRNAADARVIAGIHHISSTTEVHPSVSGDLPGPGVMGTLAIADTAQGAVLQCTNMVMKKVRSPQSIDVALTYWILEGSAGSVVTFDPPCAFQYPPNGANYYPWHGALQGGGADLLLTFLDPVYEVQAGRYIEEFAAFGPANANGIGSSAVSFICGAPTPANLANLTFDDQSRGHQTPLFGADAGGVSQVIGANGAVFAFNGTFKRWDPYDLIRFVRSIVLAQAPARGNPYSWLSDPSLRRFPQSIDEAARHSGWRQANYAQFGENFEGITVWDLNPRGAHQQQFMF